MIAFWRIWPAAYQRIFAALAGLFVLALAFLWVANFRSPAPVINPEFVQHLEPAAIPVHSFALGTTSVTVDADSYILYEHVFGGPMQPNTAAPYYFLFFLVTGLIFLLTVLTTLPRFWFFIGMGMFILIVASFRLDALILFNLPSPVLLISVLLLYCLPAYVFVFLRPVTPFFQRWACFFGVTVLIGAAIGNFSHHAAPVYFLSANGMVAAIVLTIIFLFMVAHEIIALIVFVVTRNPQQKKKLPNFLWITAIYLINLALIYADKKHIVDWHFFPFNLFLLATISSILGIWGFRQREPQYETIIKADPFGIYFFVSLAVIGFTTIGFLLSSANDPGVQLLKDTVLYSHLGYGLIFLIYLIVNFISVLGNNLPAYKVIYKPTIMPYFTFRFAGLIATFAFFAYSNWKVSVNQAYASYYNAVGDMNLSLDSTRLAEGNYQSSVFFATRNYHAHYALAQLFRSHGNLSKEKQEYNNLVDGRPLELAYLNLSQLEAGDLLLDDATRTLKKGLVDFPNSGQLQSALSLILSRRGLQDSALSLANTARSSARSREEAEANMAAVSARFQFDFPADSMLQLLGTDNPGAVSNILALAAFQGKKININVDPGPDTVLTVHAAAKLNNYFINTHNTADTALVSKTISLARRPSNVAFRNLLLASAAHALYRNGETASAFALMHEIAFLGQQHKYYNLLGLWALEQGATMSAIQFLDEGVRLNSPSSYFNRALALAEAGDRTAALQAWDSLSRSATGSKKDLATAWIRMLKASPSEALSFTDADKFAFSRHGFSVEQEKEFEMFVNTIRDPEWRARAITDRTDKLEDTDDTGLALQAFAQAQGLQFPDSALFNRITHMNLRFLAKQKQWPALEQQLRDSVSFDGEYVLDKTYFDALLAEHAGKKEEAVRLFSILGKANPFFEDAIIAAVRFRNTNGENQVDTYSLIRRALDHNPNSVKLLKVYIVQSAYVEFEESAQEALDKLKTLLHPTAFLRFINENPEIFQVTGN